MEESGKTPRFSRRFFFKTLGAGAAAGALYCMGKEGSGRLFDSIRELNQDWRTAQAHTSASFLRENKQPLAHVRLGCSFSPEQLEYFGVTMKPQDAVRFIEQELGMRDVRLSLRSNKMLGPNNTFDFRYYDRFIREFLHAGFRICWNIDGFKVARYPEHHFSQFILEGITLPPPNTTIRLTDSLARRVLAYNQALYEALEKTYGLKRRMAGGDLLQGINEPFTFAGDCQLNAAADFLAANLTALHRFFPDALLLVNSPGVPSPSSSLANPTTLQEVDSFIEQMLKTDPSLQEKLIAGFDWYGLTPLGQQLPLADRPLDMNAVVRIAGGADIIQKHLSSARRNGFLSEGTEIQWEPWGQYTGPGNSLAELIFALTRSLRLSDPTRSTLLRLWGIEYHLSQITNPSPDHLAMRSLIKQVNQL